MGDLAEAADAGARRGGVRGRSVSAMLVLLLIVPSSMITPLYRRVRW